MINNLKTLALIIVAMISISSCKADNNKIYEESNSSSNIRLQNVSNNISTSRQNAITKSVELASPAVVGINVTEVRQVYSDPFWGDDFFSQFFGRRGRQTREYQVQGLGSGFIISPDGYILTNHHVAGNASKIIVTMTNGEKYDAEIIGSDMVSDVALLKIDAKNLPYLKFGNSDDIIIAEWVIAFGNPFGLFNINAKPTVTVGVISNDEVNFIHEDQPYNRVYRNMIQTDAAISSGNSGGPLLNANGEVIGMNTVIYSTAQSNQGAGSIGIGFAIPINRVKKIIEMLKSDKKIDRDFYIGMEVREIDDNLSRYLKIKKRDGVIVYGFNRESPAENSGLKLGDVIIEINGQKINRLDDYNIIVGDCVTGDEIDIKIDRDGDIFTKSLKLKSKPRYRN